MKRFGIVTIALFGLTFLSILFILQRYRIARTQKASVKRISVLEDVQHHGTTTADPHLQSSHDNFKAIRRMTSDANGGLRELVHQNIVPSSDLVMKGYNNVRAVFERGPFATDRFTEGVVGVRVDGDQEHAVRWNVMHRDTPKLIYISDCLPSAEMRDGVIKFSIKHGLARSQVNHAGVPNEQTFHRSSTGMFMQGMEAERVKGNRWLREVASALTGVPTSHMEATQILRYELGEYYKPHYDVMTQKSDRMGPIERMGGQRIATMLLWLNDLSPPNGTIHCYGKAKTDMWSPEPAMKARVSAAESRQWRKEQLDLQWEYVYKWRLNGTAARTAETMDEMLYGLRRHQPTGEWLRGGETTFPRASPHPIAAFPKAGDAVMFWSEGPDGQSFDYGALHGAVPLQPGQGSKFVAVVWIHQKPIS